MGAVLNLDHSDSHQDRDGASTAPLGPRRERRLLEELADCRRTLAMALAREPGVMVPGESDGPRALSRFIAEVYAARGPAEDALDAVFRRYYQLRNELTLANLRLVAHVARRYLNRGMAFSDLLQEGFCGLLEAIDRFDPAHPTKLSTYAMWWIRQAIQSAVAAGAYPVSLAPRHLRQLARDQDGPHREDAHGPGRPHVEAESIQRIHAATRPAVPIDETRLAARHHAQGDPEGGLADDIDLNEAIGKWMEALRPREREVLSYRFGLGGIPRLSLSQVGKVLEVSKERVRQIQDAALKSLRTHVSCDDRIQTN